MDPGTRRPEDWEALNALDSLSPPSPSLSFEDDIEAGLNYGEIPIVFHHDDVSDINEDDDEDNHFEQPSLFNLMVPSVSIDTCGTFGRHSNHTLTIDTRRANMATSSPSTEKLSPTSLHFDVQDSDTNRTSVMSRFTVSAYLAPEMQARKKFLSPSGSDWTLPASPTKSLSTPPVSPTIQRLKSEEGLTSSTPSSPMPKYAALKSLSSASSTIISAIAGPPSPSPSTHSFEPQIDWAAAIAAIPARTARWFPPELPVVDTPKKSPKMKGKPAPKEALLRLSPKSPNANTLLQITTSSPTRKGVESPQRILHSGLRTTTSFCVKVKQLPEALSWLEYLDLEFWIDQEYRILPDKKHTRSTMRLMGFTAPDSSIPLGELDLLTDSMAEFKPAIRHTFTFHNHATADYLPVLRSVIVLNDDPKSCISRQAFISLRTNGVYSISGTETYDLVTTTPLRGRLAGSKLTTKDPHTKLKWRFEYLVTDHRDADDDIVPDQKSVTPLSFTCSPGLLHPSHGKKSRGMFDAFRQSLLPKITAEKVHAPKPPKDVNRPYGRPSQAYPVPSIPVFPTGITNTRIARNATANENKSVPSIDSKSKHRRYHSSSARCQLENGQEYRHGDGPKIPDVSMVHRPMRVRAASIAALVDVTNSGQQQYPPIGDRGVLKSKRKHFIVEERRRSMTAPDLKAIRHIIPPSELDDLIIPPTIPESIPIDKGGSMTGFTSLKPPTSHIRHRRVSPTRFPAS